MLKITEKLRPFSHQPGTSCLVPRSDWIVCAYPVMLKVGKEEFPLELTGPVREFTIQMDLERDCVWVWGIAKEGHFRFKLFAEEKGLSLLVDRCPKTGLKIGAHSLNAKEQVLLASGGRISSSKSLERLSLGNWKAQDWDLVRRRNDVREWVPLLYLLGQKIPDVGFVERGPVDLISKLPLFFHAAFTGIFVPHLMDPLHQGLFSKEGSGDPLALLTLAFQHIRSFLIQDQRILPALPSDWDCGRVLGLQMQYGLIDLEWTKGAIRQMVLHAKQEGEVCFEFPRKVKSFRCNGPRFERGHSFAVESGKKYCFDRFQK